ncbi:5-formyltetrahydrofolate cyclo-ligase [Lindgomyces ingoldianus]|uniref:5-formyltetrahydrofolate cyclo-ligase n=1 Tax=Lindgomyces ingoldianus TaxID=673940 RepID=A0ACB6QS35_9PLEO|nr:5-formyltetrahydrofolate cyclo-ligase [Lindgomyces ingoldianus]KAF2469652.1 5-formyltetrahydrofolate cyclo-ligase [Lindgomyces ingoldianus]
MATSITLMKKELRKKIKTILSELPEAAIKVQSSIAVNSLLSLPEYKAAKRVSVYLSMPSGEISTSSIVHDALQQDKQVFIPYTYKLAAPQQGQPKSVMDMLELYSLSDYESLKPDNWGIPTLSQDSISSRANSFGGLGITEGESAAQTGVDYGLDLIIMPGMAFDLEFGRLGHGKGFYDYFLQRCHQLSQMPFRVGLSLSEQLLPPNESVPVDNSDFPLDALILGDGQLHRAKT